MLRMLPLKVWYASPSTQPFVCDGWRDEADDAPQVEEGSHMVRATLRSLLLVLAQQNKVPSIAGAVSRPPYKIWA